MIVTNVRLACNSKMNVDVLQLEMRSHTVK